ncbi:MAG: PAS domain S-box protein [Phycisphaerae bacterium]|nr:PAS domain S-box protein [Phycisphaerae bacterium]
MHTSAEPQRVLSGRLRRGIDSLLLLVPMVIVVGSLAAIVYTTGTLAELRSNARMIDVAGQQRMLCEQHTKQVLLALNGIEADHATTRREFHRRSAVLREGGTIPRVWAEGDSVVLSPAPTRAVRDGVARAETLMIELESVADALTVAPPGAEKDAMVQRLLDLDARLLAATDDVVVKLESHTSQRIDRLVRSASAVGVLVVLLGVSLLWLLARLRRLNLGLEHEVDRRRSSEAELRSILASALDPIVTIDARGIIQSASDSVETVFGWTVDELQGRNVSMLMPEPHESRHDGYLAEYRRTGHAKMLGQTREMRARRHDGSTFPCELRINAVNADRREKPLFAGIIRDISQRLEREEHMRRLSRGIESAGEAFILADASGSIAYLNRAFVRLTGFDEDEVVGRPFSRLPCLSATALEAIDAWRTKPDSTKYSQDVTSTRKDGSTFRAAITVAPEYDTNGGFDGFVAVLRDISDLTAAQELLETTARELEARNAEMEQFVYTVSHDLKSPLVTIRGFAGHLAKDVEAGNEKRIGEDIDAIRRATHRMSDLIDDLLELSRVGRVVGEPSCVDLREVVDRSLSSFADEAEQGNLVAEIGDLPCLLVDPTRIQQVFDNLVGNAMKYGADAGVVRLKIEATRVDDTISVRVADRGPGIDPAYHDKIFNLFARLSTGTDGTGIGLAICKRVVEHLNGRICVESEPGRGATFRLDLPASLADALEDDTAVAA